MRKICEVPLCEKFVKGYRLCENHLKKHRRGTLDTTGLSLMASKATDDAGRFERYVDKSGECWPWTGSLDTKGYGVIRYGEKLLRAHRWVYEAMVGPIPDDLDLDHECHNRDHSCPGGVECPHRRCVKPEHLRPKTRAENLAAGRGGKAKNESRTLRAGGDAPSGTH